MSSTAAEGPGAFTSNAGEPEESWPAIATGGRGRRFAFLTDQLSPSASLSLSLALGPFTLLSSSFNKHTRVHASLPLTTDNKEVEFIITRV